MHELSIAIGIVNIADKECKKSGMKKVELIELEIGTLSGVQLDSLDYVWHAAVKDTILENSERKIHQIQAQAICLECELTYSLDHIYDSCPICNSYFRNIIKGQELRVKSLEVS